LLFIVYIIYSEINECEERSNICDQVCTSETTGYSCSCYSGYYLIGNYTCGDINECDEPNKCHTNSQCNNTVGSYSCSCDSDYYDYYGDGTFCEPAAPVNIVCDDGIGEAENQTINGTTVREIYRNLKNITNGDVTELAKILGEPMVEVRVEYST